jgi:hypothetical protein
MYARVHELIINITNQFYNLHLLYYSCTSLGLLPSTCLYVCKQHL